jgi:hypothetical protein
MTKILDLLGLNVNPDTFHVSNHESRTVEFKKYFNSDDIWEYAQTIVAFANCNGGVIFFGISESPRTLVGVKGYEPDESSISNHINGHYEPEVPFELGTKEFYGKKILYILVKKSTKKPIICKKEKFEHSKEKGKTNKQLLREGAIYYRYASTTKEIKCLELKNILDERAKNIFRSFVDKMEIINKVGHDRAVIVDASELSGDNKTATVYMTPETVKHMNWIMKGRFSETQDEAAKAFFVTKTVEIKHGMGFEKLVPTDPSKTHRFTKTDLGTHVKITSPYLHYIMQDLDLLNKEEYHFTQKHGKSVLNKFSDKTAECILRAYPFEMEDRQKKIIEVYKTLKNAH